MKKVIVILAVCFSFMLSACGNQANGQNNYINGLGVDLSGGTVISDSDTHGGFHGDGYRLQTIQYSDDSLEHAIVADGNWHKLPCTANLNTFIYQPYDVNLKIPKVEKGYYFLYDRHSESKDPYSDEDLLSRSSFNFTFAIYDSESKILYVCEYDT